MDINDNIVKVLRGVGRQLLADRYGELEPISGQGVQSGIRFAISEGGERLICAIKVAAGEDVHRIHFPRNASDGTWSTLKDVDRVLYLRRRPDRRDKYEAQMHSQAVLLEAFDKNYAHTASVGMGHLPAWLSPDVEEGDRFVGSGYGTKALWKATGRLHDSDGVKPAVATAPEVRPLTIQEAKDGIAASLGIAPEAIEIIIRA
jgi:hypothetical protein